MKESSVNVTLGVGEIVKEVKDTKTIEEVDKTSALVVRAIHAALSPLEKWVLQKEYIFQKQRGILIRGFGQVFSRACLGGDFSNIN